MFTYDHEKYQNTACQSLLGHPVVPLMLLNAYSSGYNAIEVIVKDYIRKTNFVSLSTDGWTDVRKNVMVYVVVHPNSFAF
jgi:hypothetical protein